MRKIFNLLLITCFLTLTVMAPCFATGVAVPFNFYALPNSIQQLLDNLSVNTKDEQQTDYKAKIKQHLNVSEKDTLPTVSTLVSTVYHLQRGLSKLDQKKYQHSWGELSYVLYYFPNQPKALQAISELALYLNQTQQAKSYFQRALKLFPEDTHTLTLYQAFLKAHASNL